MTKPSLFGRVIYLLHVIDKNNQNEMQAPNFSDEEITKTIEMLHQLDMVTEENNLYKLTEKGRNVLTFFDKETSIDGQPLIRVR
jgi:predicted transcriptional regulator